MYKKYKWIKKSTDSFSNSTDYQTAADLTGQANHIGVTIKADIIKQKLPTLNDGFRDPNSVKFELKCMIL